MEEIILTSQPPFTVGHFRLMPLVKLSLLAVEIDGLLAFNCAKEPAFLLISDGHRVRVLKSSGEEVTIGEVKAEYSIRRIDPALANDFPLLAELR